jgi:hypothetical protein
MSLFPKKEKGYCIIRVLIKVGTHCCVVLKTASSDTLNMWLSQSTTKNKQCAKKKKKKKKKIILTV